MYVLPALWPWTHSACVLVLLFVEVPEGVIVAGHLLVAGVQRSDLTCARWEMVTAKPSDRVSPRKVNTTLLTLVPVPCVTYFDHV